MKKLLTAATLSLMLTLSVMPAMALEYSIDAPGDPPYPNSTSVDPAITVGGGTTDDSNIDRSKDTSLIPPPFGSPESNLPGTGTLPDPTPIPSPGSNDDLPGPGNTDYPPTLPDGPTGPISTPTTKFTLPDGLFYSDGSLARLTIPKIGLSVKVYETESMESLAKGAGHFKSTSCWDGNVGLAGHNRGVTNHFGRIHTLKAGDTITYTTQLGTRTYSVFYVGQIQNTDFSHLGRTSENIITLITCVENVPSMRWCVQAREIS